MKKVLLLGLFAICISSCSTKLSKEEASEIIKTYYPTYCTSKKIRSSVRLYASDGGVARNRSRKKLEMFYDLEKQGLVTVKEKHTGFTNNPDIKYYFELTEKAKGIYGEKIGLTATEFVEIIGISQTENVANIKYKVKSVETPFYPLHKVYARKLTCYETTWEEDIVLVKYDTGWRVK